LRAFAGRSILRCMPMYEYVCRKCSHPFEELVFGGEQPKCPQCDAPEVDKVLSAHTVGRSEAPAPRFAQGGPCGGCQNPGACGMN